ncbi:HAD family hydrolase [Paenibacillus sp. S150]|uniref:HAD family hydrolase n=1 Tax=Paenibacillus sp. S150 TaxID=2749826 RepID=UPI001C581636|nr:HAD family hydrolase [Paenibacillus sp. S150]MBW4083080.1 HAD family hydrolase [Paenibacillus sp. S150]
MEAWRLQTAKGDYPRKPGFGLNTHHQMPLDAAGADPAVAGNLLDREGIRSIFFDVDDTLYSQFDLTCNALRAVLAFPEGFAFRDAYRRIGYYSEKLSAEGNLLQASPQGERAAQMREERFIRGLADFGVQASCEQGAQIQKEYTRLQGEMRINEGAGELLASLIGCGIIVGIITNGNEEHQRSKLQTLGLSRYVPEERTVISGKAGFMKPDPRIFRLANECTGTKAEESLYIGDSWSKDIAGASAAGWQAIWFNPLQDKPGTGDKPAAVASTFAELRELLGLQEGNGWPGTHG